MTAATPLVAISLHLYIDLCFKTINTQSRQIHLNHCLAIGVASRQGRHLPIGTAAPSGSVTLPVARLLAYRNSDRQRPALDNATARGQPAVAICLGLYCVAVDYVLAAPWPAPALASVRVCAPASQPYEPGFDSHLPRYDPQNAVAKKSVRLLCTLRSTVPTVVPALQRTPPLIHNGRQCIVRAPSAQRLVSHPTSLALG